MFKDFVGLVLCGDLVLWCGDVVVVCVSYECVVSFLFIYFLVIGVLVWLDLVDG